jgi:hypothetical protein
VLPAPAPAPALAAGLRSATLGNCEECGHAEWAASAERVVLAAPGGPPDCSGTAAGAAGALAAFAGAPAVQDAAFAGPLTALVGEGEPTAACGAVAVVIPSGARYVGYRFEAIDGAGSGVCAADRPCSLPQARWQGHPKVERGGERTVIWGVFANGSAERDRRARLTVYFVPPADWQPPAAQ